MKKVLFSLLGVFMFFSCSSDDSNSIKPVSDSKEVSYIKANLPEIMKLSSEDIEKFKNSMKFNESNELSSWSYKVLRKAFEGNKEGFDRAVIILSAKLGSDIGRPIVIVNSDNEEYIISTDDLKKANVRMNGMVSGTYVKSTREMCDADPKDPGTYHYEDKRNRWTAPGCKRDIDSICELKVRGEEC